MSMTGGNWWEDFSPEELQALFDEMNASSGDQGIYDFGSSAIDPAAAAIMPNVAIPELTNKGEEVPFDLSLAAKEAALLKSYGGLSVDNILTGYAGGGAYDTDAFTPTYDYGEPVNRPGHRKAEATAAAGGYRAALAKLILEGGLDPSQAEAKLYEMATAPDDPSLTDQERAAKADLLATMPPSMKTAGPNDLLPSGGALSDAAKGRQQWDTERISKDAFEIWNDLMEDPEFKYQDPETGLYYNKTPEEAMVKTPQMMAFDKFGIPYPTDSYQDPGRLDEMATASSGMTGAEREAMMEPYLANMEGLGNRSAETGRSMMDARTARQGLERLQGQPDRAPFDPSKVQLDQYSTEAAQTAANLDYESLMENENAPGRPQLDDFIAQAVGRSTVPPPTTGQWGTSESSRDYDASMEAANVAGNIDYESAFEDWQNEQKQRLLTEATTRAQGKQIPLLPPDRAVYNTPGGDIAPYDFGGGFNPVASYEALSAQAPRSVSQADITKQKAREHQTVKDRYAAQLAFTAGQRNDPQIAAAGALGRALALARLGRTPFRDAMETRNNSTRRMLSGG